jgi:hypothetical protein
MLQEGLVACPKCRKSMVRRKAEEDFLQAQIDASPMPPAYRRKCKIACNDCNERTVTNLHWLGVRCRHCGSFNTGILTTWIKGERPEDEALEVVDPSTSNGLAVGLDGASDAAEVSDEDEDDIEDDHDADDDEEFSDDSAGDDAHHDDLDLD